MYIDMNGEKRQMKSEIDEQMDGQLKRKLYGVMGER